MTYTAKIAASNTEGWDEVLALYQGQLAFYLDYLLLCDCNQQLLSRVEADVRERFVPEEFKHRFLLRTLVRIVIQHLQECSGQTKVSHNVAEGSTNLFPEIPQQERLVYFMRDILEYSTRDTSLLLGKTDSQVESLLSIARKRIDMTEGPSSTEIQMPDCTYFRWKFVDLHLA